MKKTGLVLIIVGVLLTIFTALTFFTKEKVVDIGAVHITRNEPHNLRWSPLIGIAIAGLGGVLLLVNSKGSKVL
jgi:hypothetical protein